MWSNFWPALSTVFGLGMVVVYLAVCVATIAFIARAFHRRHGDATPVWLAPMPCCGPGLASSKQNIAQEAIRADWPRAAIAPTSFDRYRAETLRYLEEEQSDFQEFLDRLRTATDKAQFDELMQEHERHPLHA